MHEKQFSTLKEWLNSYLNNKPTEKYQILTSDYNGNGITTLCKQLAKEFNLKFTEITSLDITTKDDLPKIQNLLLSTTFTSQKRLIVFDEVHEIKYKDKIFKLIQLSRNPVILTTTQLYKLPKQYRKNIVRIYKPDELTMIKILKQKAQDYNLAINNEKLYEIIAFSPSLATSINALFSKFPSELTGTTSYYSLYYNFLKNRKVLADNLFLYWLVDNLIKASDSSFFKIISNIYSLPENLNIYLYSNLFNADFSSNPSYPLYFQYKSSSLKNKEKIVIFLKKLTTILHTSVREVINSYLPLIKQNMNDEWLSSQIAELGLNKEELRILGIKYIKKEVKQKLERVKHKQQIRLDGYF